MIDVGSHFGYDNGSSSMQKPMPNKLRITSTNYQHGTKIDTTNHQNPTPEQVTKQIMKAIKKNDVK